MQLSSRALVIAMCLGQVGNLLPHVAVPSVMPQHLMPLWHLSGSQAGMMASAFAVGYMLAVPLLTTLTDRIDARKILLVGSAVSALATLAFGLFADGLWSATAIWFVAGVGFAGAYMPGLKALTDRLPPGDASRSITLYTSSFSFGVGISFLISQLLAEHFGWRIAFLVTGIGPVIMIAACIALPAVRPVPSTRRLLDFMPVIRNRPAMGYILGYGAHCFELYGIRTWLVAFWTFVAARHPDTVPAGAVAVSTVFALLSMPASILGNEAALRFGRHATLTVLMLASALVAVAVGLNAGGAPWLLAALLFLYALTVPAEFRHADFRHGDERGPGPQGRHHGDAFDRRFRTVGCGRVGCRRDARPRGRAFQSIGLACGVRSARGLDPARPCRIVVVAAPAGSARWRIRFCKARMLTPP